MRVGDDGALNVEEEEEKEEREHDQAQAMRYGQNGGERKQSRTPPGHELSAGGPFRHRDEHEAHSRASSATTSERHGRGSRVGPMQAQPTVEETGEPRREDEEQGCNFCECVLKTLSFIIIVFTFPVSLAFCLKTVQEYERAVIYRLGRMRPEPQGPGLFFVIPCIDNFHKLDLRTVTFNVPPQEILSRDSVTVTVDAVLYYRIRAPTKAVNNVENVNRSTQLLGMATLRNILGTKNMTEILSEREHTSALMQTMLHDATSIWGVHVERVEIKDVKLPRQLQRAMAAEAEATREAKAKVIAAEGEQNASHALKEAADVLNESPAALQLRYLQSLNTIAAERNSTIIFPLPIDMLSAITKKK